MITPTSKFYEYLVYGGMIYFGLLVLYGIADGLVKVWRLRHGR